MGSWNRWSFFANSIRSFKVRGIRPIQSSMDQVSFDYIVLYWHRLRSFTCVQYSILNCFIVNSIPVSYSF